ncbi:MAG: hypothetical protein ACRDT6_11205 [Micromonosporaceae bacterium]
MSTAVLTPARTTPVQTVVVGAVGGAVAGMMMAAVQMAYGLASASHTIWDAPMAIWAWVAGIENFGPPADHVAGIVLGLGGHMANSMMVGVGFALLMSYVVKARGALTAVMVGVLYGLGIWVAMRYVILPLNPGESALFTTELVSPQWVWWLSHVVLGMTAGVWYLAVGRRR